MTVKCSRAQSGRREFYHWFQAWRFPILILTISFKIKLFSSSTNKYVSFSYEDSTWNMGPEPGNNVADVLAISNKICPEQIDVPWYEWVQYGGLKPCCFSTCLDNIEPPKNAPSPCDSNPCENGAVCTDDGFDFTCACPNGYYGNKCQNSKFEDKYSVRL